MSVFKDGEQITGVTSGAGSPPQDPPKMGALEAALRGFACQCGRDVEGHEASEHLTPGERKVFEQVERDGWGICAHRFDSTVCVKPARHEGPHATSNAAFPHGLVIGGAAPAPPPPDVIQAAALTAYGCPRCGSAIGGAHDVDCPLAKPLILGASAPTPEPSELDEAALAAAERAYWKDAGVSRHNLAVAIRAYLAVVGRGVATGESGAGAAKEYGSPGG